MLATHTPWRSWKARGVATLDEAFISYLEAANGVRAPSPAGRIVDAVEAGPGADDTALSPRRASPALFSLCRMLAYTARETLELLRDPIRLSFALLGTAFLMSIFGFGITTDVDNLSFAVLDRDQTPASRAYLGELRGSRYFIEKAPLVDYADLDRRMAAGTSRRRSRFRRASVETSKNEPPRQSEPGSMAQCRSAPRRSVATCRASTSST